MPAALVLSGLFAWLAGALLMSAQPTIPAQLENAWCGPVLHAGTFLSGTQHCAGCAAMLTGLAAAIGGAILLTRPPGKQVAR